MISSLVLASITALDAVLNQSVGWKLAPSVSVAVVEDGKIVYADARGSAQLDPRQSAGVETQYQIGSLGGLFLAVAAAQLDLKMSTSDDAAYERLGDAIERASGMPLTTYLYDRVFRPAGMTHTWAGEPPAWARLATGYYEFRDAFGEVQADVPTRKCCSFISTAADLARFDLALLDGKLTHDATLTAIMPAFEAHDYAGMQMIGREGTPSGFSAQNVIVPSKRFAVVTLANVAGFPGQIVLAPVVKTFFPDAVAAHPLPSSDLEQNPAITRRVRELIVAQRRPLGNISGTSLISTSESAGATEYRYLVDFDSGTHSAFLVVEKDGKTGGFWLH